MDPDSSTCLPLSPSDPVQVVDELSGACLPATGIGTGHQAGKQMRGCAGGGGPRKRRGGRRHDPRVRVGVLLGFTPGPPVGAMFRGRWETDDHHQHKPPTPIFVHKPSTDAASSLLVTALNDGRDVILDGTLSWEPFVEQTIAMARAIHRQRYRMGVGYKADAGGGKATENYWEPDDTLPRPPGIRRPYRIEVVGVVCDAYLAVARGIRRAIITGRAVRVKSQLQSHKRFAAAFQRYSQLVDGARLYSTNSMGSAQLIAWKDGNSSLLVEPREFACLEKVSYLNENATSVHDLYPDGTTTCGSRSIWEDMVVSPSRATVQRELREVIRSLETVKAAPATATT